jgi:Spy/CpxP family protein refolding chaperone
MITEKKIKILIWLVIVLAITNLSTIGTLLWMRYQPPPFFKPFMKNERFMNSPEGGKGPWFMKQMNLTDSQSEEFHQHTVWFRQNAKQLADEMATYREEMMTEMSATNPDTIKLNALSQQIGNNHAKLKQLSYQYFLKLKSACPPDQIEPLKQSFRHLMHHDGENRSGRGKGNMGNPNR